MSDPLSVPAERAIRVFVSSTFRDMQAEREELVKRVFPLVRRMCEERGVAWSEVDLRWGVTDEQKAEGAVLPICLAEIDRSRPYFLGLLGQRYGWVPEEIPENLTAELPWLAHLPGTSVTEMEILHGVLNDPDAAGSAYFHLRDPAYVDTRPPEEQLVLGELPTADEVTGLGAEVAEAQAADRRRRLAELRQRIQASPHPSREYADPQELGRQVLEELTALVDRLFPIDQPPDLGTRDDEAHRAFGLARAAGHLDRPAVTDRLTEHLEATSPPLALHAPPGSDLTPLVATWLDRWRQAHPDDLVVQHHVGATSDASDWKHLARRIIRAVGDAPTELPDDALALRGLMFAALGRAPGRLVLIVDGVDLLDDEDGAPDLTWLPAAPPDSVRVVLTSAGARPVEEALRRGWPVVEVQPLTDTERRDYIKTFLARWAKGLDPVHVDVLAGSTRTGNVLYLRTILDELRQHGDHFTLGDVIARYLSAETIDDLLELVLGRYERDFEREHPGLVREAFSALWAARRGLTEPELLEHLGGPDTPVTSAVWSPLVLAAEDGLITRSGLLGFATDVHRKAVEDRYLPDEAAQRQAHAALAAYFEAQPLGPRKVAELPWQQLAAGDVDGLVRTLADLDFLDLAYPTGPGDLRRLWARAEEQGRSSVDAYRPVLEHPEAHPDQLWAVARLVTDSGHPREALALHRQLVETYRQDAAGGDPQGRPAQRLRGSLLNLGAALEAQGDLDGAARAWEEAIDLARPAGDRVVLQSSLGNLGTARREQGDLASALPMLRESLDLARESGDPSAVQAALGNLAGGLRAAGEYAEALGLLEEQEQLCRSVGDRHGVALALAGKAAIHGDTGDPAATLAALETWRADATERGDLSSQVEALLTESVALRQLARWPEAAERGGQAEAIARRLADEPMLARVLDQQARQAIDEQRWEDARRLATEAVLTARSAGAQQALVLALGSLGMAQRELGDLPSSRASHTEELALATQLGDQAAVAVAQVNLAAVDIVGQDFPSALQRYAAAEPVLRHLGLAMSLVPLLNNRWQVHAAMGDHAAAIADLIACGEQCAILGADEQRVQVLKKAAELLYQTGRMTEAEPVLVGLADASRRTGDDAGLQRALGERALIVLGRGDRAGARQLLDQQEEVCRRIGDQVGLASCIGNRAILLQQEGDLAGALACIDEQLSLARATNNGQGYLFATANRGEVLGYLGRTQEALAALTEARGLAAQWNLAPMVTQLDQMITALRAKAN